MLQHRETGKIRIVMRRDKTLKICANHLILAEMQLKPNVSSDRSWVYTAVNDLSEGQAATELLAVRLANAEVAKEFKEKFEEAQTINSTKEEGKPKGETFAEEKKKGEKDNVDDKAQEEKKDDKQESSEGQKTESN